MSLPAGLPTYAVLAEALRTTTERLAHEVAAPSPAAPDWNEVEWDVARAVAAMQGTSALLANRLSWRGPESWQRFLAAQRHLAAQRDARIESLLARLEVALHAARTGCIALKGSSLRRLGLYRPGERPMGDVDLLANTDDAERVMHALEGLDYACVSDMRRHRIFSPRVVPAAVEPGEHPDNPLRIELHFRVAEMLPVRLVDITAALLPEDRPWGLGDYPHLRELFRHLLLHAAGNMRAHALRQIQLHDIALLAPRLSPTDWDVLLETPESRGGTWWMWPALDFTRRYYPGSIPAVVEEFRARAPRWLRHAVARKTLTDVSWSNLRIAAFPGIYWSRSAPEVMRFMRSRVIPGRVALAELSVTPRFQPAMLNIPWYGIPHGQRIFRWMFSRAPRVQTLMSVQSALITREQP